MEEEPKMLDVNPAPAQRERLLKLPAALAKAQGQMESARFDAKAAISETRSYKYATLAAVMDAIRKPFADNGLCFTQLPTTTEQSGVRGVMVITRLIHESGEEVVNRLWLPVTNPTPQGYGSAITYAKRYSLCAVAGVATDDDDANEATHGNHPIGPSKPKPPPKAEKPVEKPVEQKTEKKPSGEVTEADKLAAAMDEAQTVADLNKLMPRLMKLPEGDKAPLKQKFTSRLNEVKKNEPAEPGSEG